MKKEKKTGRALVAHSCPRYEDVISSMPCKECSFEAEFLSVREKCMPSATPLVEGGKVSILGTSPLTHKRETPVHSGDRMRRQGHPVKVGGGRFRADTRKCFTHSSVKLWNFYPEDIE